MGRKERQMTWADYGISPLRKRELVAFCMQYPEIKQQISYGLRSMQYDGMPRGNATGNPTEMQAVRNSELQEKIALIEQTIHDAAPEIYEALLENVIYGTPYEYILNPGINVVDFYAYRRKFFGLLHQRRK